MSEKISVHTVFSPARPRFKLVLNNLSSYCGLVDAKIRASDKDLPVLDVKVAFIQKVLIHFSYP